MAIWTDYAGSVTEATAKKEETSNAEMRDAVTVDVRSWLLLTIIFYRFCGSCCVLRDNEIASNSGDR
jgi:hypothetical protein